MQIFADEHVKKVNDWSPDDRYIVFSGPDRTLSAVAADGKSAPIRLVPTQFLERDAQVSPDGRWIAYQSEESGRSDVYVQQFLGTGERAVVSHNGGAEYGGGRTGARCTTSP